MKEPATLAKITKAIKTGCKFIERYPMLHAAMPTPMKIGCAALKGKKKRRK
jgi:hypothetical protein